MKDFIEYESACLLKLKFDYKLAEEKNLTSDECTIYFKIQSLYKKVFEYKINQLLDLTGANELLRNSDLGFGSLSDSKKKYYHKISYLNLDYIYIQNFLFIEKLDIDYLNVFRERILKKNYAIDEVLLEIVDKTFKEIMKAGSTSDERGIVCYGFESPVNHFNNDSLVIRIEYGRNTINLNNQEFLENYNKKKKLLDEVIKKIKDSGKRNNIIVETRVMKIM